MCLHLEFSLSCLVSGTSLALLPLSYLLFSADGRLTELFQKLMPVQLGCIYFDPTNPLLIACIPCLKNRLYIDYLVGGGC